MSDELILRFALVGFAFLIAGGVKGLVGMGMPTVALALMATVLRLPEAMALMLAPTLITNIWQALAGPHLGAILRRFWPFLLALAPGIWFGTALLAGLDIAVLTIFLGGIVAFYAAFTLIAPPLPLPGRAERPLSGGIGLVAGLVTGMTGTFVVPGVLWLQALRLERDMLVQCMGVLFASSTLLLAIALGGRGLVPGLLAGQSAFAVLPALIGMWAGAKLRRRLSEAAFRRLFSWALLLLGLWIAGRTFLLGLPES